MKRIIKWTSIVMCCIVLQACPFGEDFSEDTTPFTIYNQSNETIYVGYNQVQKSDIINNGFVSTVGGEGIVPHGMISFYVSTDMNDMLLQVDVAKEGTLAGHSWYEAQRQGLVDARNFFTQEELIKHGYCVTYDGEQITLGKKEDAAEMQP